MRSSLHLSLNREPTPRAPVSGGSPRAPRSTPVVASPDDPTGAASCDSGQALLAAFTPSALLIVGLIVVAPANDCRWILLPLMAVDLWVTTVGLGTVVRLLDDPG
jgi:hypothetical protein